MTCIKLFIEYLQP